MNISMRFGLVWFGFCFEVEQQIPLKTRIQNSRNIFITSMKMMIMMIIIIIICLTSVRGAGNADGSSGDGGG